MSALFPLVCGTLYLGCMLPAQGASPLALAGLYLCGIGGGMRFAHALLRGPLAPAA